MNNLQSLQDTLSAFQSSLEKMNTELTVAYAPVLQSISKMQNIIASTLSPQINLTTQMRAQYESMLEPFKTMSDQWNASILAAFNNESLQRQLHIMQDSFSSYASSLQAITIHEDYVSIPESLIPDGFDCEEITPQSKKSLAEKTKVKHLSYQNAIALLAIIIPLLCWIITCIREDISSNKEQLRHQESIAIQKEAVIAQKAANQLQEEENRIQQKQLEATERVVAHLFAIYQQLQEFDSTSPNIGSHCQCVPSQSEPASLQSDLDAPSNPTEVDDSERIDGNANSSALPSKFEQQ